MLDNVENLANLGYLGKEETNTVHVGIASTLCWAYPIEDVIYLAKEAGVVGVEVWAEHVWEHGSDVDTIDRARKETGIFLTVHAASWDLNLCALNEGIRLQSINEIKRSLELASRIGADNVTFHPGKLTLAAVETEWYEARMFHALERIVDLGRGYGLTLSLEMMEWKKDEFITTPGMVAKMINPFSPVLKTTFDVAHIPLDQDIISIWRQTPHVNKIHISDATAQTLHLPLGSGDIKPDILDMFLQIRDVPVIIEGFDASRELVWLEKNLRFVTQSVTNPVAEVTN